MSAIVGRSRGLLGWAPKAAFYWRSLSFPGKADRPYLVRLDINDSCNQECAKCFYPAFRDQGNKPHSMSLDEFRLLAKKLFPSTYYLQIPFGFEPLLHPEFPEMMAVTASYGIRNVGIVTNGSRLSGRNADAILHSRCVTAVAVSLDTVDRELYSAIHGRDHLHRVQSNLIELLRRRNAERLPFPQVYVNATLESRSLDNLPALLEWCVAAGVDEVQFFHLDPMDPGNPNSALAAPERYNRVRGELERIVRRVSTRVYLPPPFNHNPPDAASNGLSRHIQGEDKNLYGTTEFDRHDPDDPHPYPHDVFCICPWMTWVIDTWGNVYPCAHRVGEPFGNILRDSTAKAFNSLRHLRLRDDLLDGRLQGACSACRSKSFGSDPMKRRLTRTLRLDPSQKVRNEKNGADTA